MKLLNATINRIKRQDESWRQRARERLNQLTMPHWALGRLMDLALDLAGMTHSLKPSVARKGIVTMAADHGVAAEGVSQYPQEVTAQMVRNFVDGGAGINALAGVAGARIIVVDMGVADALDAMEGKILSRRQGAGTQNITVGPAMSPDQAIASIEAGIQLADKLSESIDLLGTGDMGIGNTTPSAAIAAAVVGCPVSQLVGRGTGIDDTRLRHKTALIEKALDLNQPNREDGLDLLNKVGGFEIGGMAGLMLGAATQGRPVVVDGYISTAAALIAQLLAPASVDYMILSHLSAEGGHWLMCDHLGKEPLLNLHLRLGEGTGAALAMPLVEAAAAVLTQIKTFEEASVSRG